MLSILNFNFHQFIQVVMKDRHVQSVFYNCCPCSIDFTYILSQKTLDEDFQFIFSELNITETSIQQKKNVNKEKLNKDVEDHFKKMPRKLLWKVYDMLKEDFYLFNFDIPDYIPISVHDI